MVEVIYALIPGMILSGLIMVGIFIWAVKKGQYEDMEGDAHRILLDDDEVAKPPAAAEHAERREDEH
jgi:cbb3-type cytochrome oxidase maturation protein